MEATSSFRPYRAARGIEAALEIITENKGIQYDAEVVEACQALFASGDFQFDYGKENPFPRPTVPLDNNARTL